MEFTKEHSDGITASLNAIENLYNTNEIQTEINNNVNERLVILENGLKTILPNLIQQGTAINDIDKSNKESIAELANHCASLASAVRKMGELNLKLHAYLTAFINDYANETGRLTNTAPNDLIARIRNKSQDPDKKDGLFVIE